MGSNAGSGLLPVAGPGRIGADDHGDNHLHVSPRSLAMGAGGSSNKQIDTDYSKDSRSGPLPFVGDRGLEKTLPKGDDELRVAPRGKVARNRYTRVRHSLRLDVNLAPKLVDRGLMLFYLLTSEMCRILA